MLKIINGKYDYTFVLLSGKKMETLKIVQKNLRVLFRSKMSWLIIFLGPLFILLIAGFAFNNTASYKIKIGVYSDNYSDTSERFISNLNERVEIIKLPSSDLCQNSITTKGYHSCLIIPPNLQIDSQNNDSANQIEYYIDNSKINIADFIEQSIYLSIQNTSTSISSELTSVLVNTTILTKEELINSELKIRSLQIKLNDTNSKVDQSKVLSSSTNLDFNKSSFKTTDLTANVNSAKNQFTSVSNIAKDATSEYNSTIKTLSPLNVSNSVFITQMNNSKSDIASLGTRIQADATNETYFSNIVSISGTITSQVNSLDSNLQAARNNKQQISANLDAIKVNTLQSQNDSQLVLQSMDKIVAQANKNKILDADNIVSPVALQRHEIVSGSKLTYLFPNLVILIIMIITLMMSSSQTIQEKLGKSNVRMAMTPISPVKKIMAQFYSIMIVVIIQVILLLTLIYFAFHVNVLDSLLAISGVLLLVAMFFTLLGIIIGGIFNTEQTTLLGTISVASIFLILSDMILPLESMPDMMIKIISHTPFIVGTDLLRKVIFFNTSFSDTSFRVLILYFLSTLLIILVYYSIKRIAEKVRARRSLS